MLTGDVFKNLGIDDVFNLADFLIAHRLIMHKVKTRLVGVDQRTFLLHVAAEHFAQSLVHQVRNRVIAHDAATHQQVDLGIERIATLERTGLEHALMTENGSLYLLRILNFKNPLG